MLRKILKGSTVLVVWLAVSYPIVASAQSPLVGGKTCADRADGTTVCDTIFLPQQYGVHASRPIRGSVMDIKWAGDSVVIVRAINTLSGYRVEQENAGQYFQIELSENDGIAPSDLSVSTDGRWLALAEGQKIKIFDLKDGSLKLTREFNFGDNQMFISAIAFSNRGGQIVDERPDLIYAISNERESWIGVTNIFSVTSPNGSPRCQSVICGMNAQDNRVDVDPVGESFAGVIGTLFPIRSHVVLSLGLAGYEGLVQSSDCKKSWFVSSAKGNPRKTIHSNNEFLPCRRFNYPLGSYSVDFLSARKFPNPLVGAKSFEPAMKGGKVLIAIGTSKKCEGVQIDQISLTRKGWAGKNLECIKKLSSARETTSVQFSKTGRYIAIGGADTDFSIITYPEKKDVKID